MCDTYHHKCMFCENELSLHIADFCTKRKNITVICPDCTLKNYFDPRGLYIGRYKQLFVVKVDDKDQINGTLKDGRYKGKLVLIFCTDENAYGIRLN